MSAGLTIQPNHWVLVAGVRVLGVAQHGIRANGPVPLGTPLAWCAVKRWLTWPQQRRGRWWQGGRGHQVVGGSQRVPPQGIPNCFLQRFWSGARPAILLLLLMPVDLPGNAHMHRTPLALFLNTPKSTVKTSTHTCQQYKINTHKWTNSTNINTCKSTLQNQHTQVNGMNTDSLA